MNLTDLLVAFNNFGIFATSNSDVSGLRCAFVTADSRQVILGSCFFAIPGVTSNGADYVAEAVERGATVVVVSNSEIGKFQNESNTQPLIIGVDNVRYAYAIAAQLFNGNPSENITSVAVTGTNGKTSVAWIIGQALAILNAKCAYVGTLGIKIFSKENDAVVVDFNEESGVTTPDALKMAQTLYSLKEKSISAVAVEVSSHALDQYRTSAIAWDAAIVTNITRDHLDYHETFEKYALAKKQLFTRELLQGKKDCFAVLNIDDDLIATWKEEFDAVDSFAALAFSSDSKTIANISLEKAELGAEGSSLKVLIEGEKVDVRTQLVGSYNAENTLAAISTLHGLGYSAGQIATALEKVSPVPGRMQPVGCVSRPIIVDYAHTPDALDSVLSSICEIHKGKITTVFGCGGDRDRGKRAMMAAVAEKLSGEIIVTSDNPRSEDPSAIIGDICSGFSCEASYCCVVDRREAIEMAVSKQEDGELILIAGKGHEDYQEISGKRYPFLDEAVVRESQAHNCS